MAANARHVQLSRMLGTTIEDDESARRALAARPGDFASALFLEAADSDDVTSAESALEYLEGRLATFADLLSAQAADAVRGAFGERLKAWA
jgi:hypothetical protein